MVLGRGDPDRINIPTRSEGSSATLGVSASCCPARDVFWRLIEVEVPPLRGVLLGSTIIETIAEPWARSSGT